MTSSEPSSSGVIRIIICTDNHLGYLEEDPVRGDDPFPSFEEVLQLATKSACSYSAVIYSTTTATLAVPC